MGRILLAEDEPNISAAVTFLLEREGHAVTLASDGEAALQALAGQAFDLAILDIMLPQRSGFEILKALRATPPLDALPVLVLTAKSQTYDRETAQRVGANAFLTKPFSNAELVAAVTGLLETPMKRPPDGPAA